MEVAGIVAGLCLLVLLSTYLGRGFGGLVLAGGGGLITWAAYGAPSQAWFGGVGGAYALLVILFSLPPVRRAVVTSIVFRVMKGVLPRLGETERTALEAGTVWWDGEIFSGSPNWKVLFDFSVKPLSAEERAFLDGPVVELCEKLDLPQIEAEGDLSPETWDFIKEKGFFGMIIPKEHGGLGFSAAAHSAIVAKVSSRSITAAVTVMVPNSLGPAELLLHYGTDEQKKHYLPRLAKGQEIPCFALTGPEAGSDAAATQSVGIVCKGEYEGEEVLGMRLTWRKRYITLGPVATVIGLAFRLKDPDRLLGGETDLGITCALIPSHLDGIDIGARHDPMGVPFHNGPNSGRDVFVPLEFIIGGQPMAGQGWRMLMECLAVGRSISLPALSIGGIQLAARVVGAYATVREQFDTPIGRFEGIEEPLARIGGMAYLTTAAGTMTAGAVDAGEKPAVASAIVKCYLTEAMRACINDAMDIRAGAAICRGPRNMLARAYAAAPIGITVEGANILTRSMIIYGQGAIRCHPFVQEQMIAVTEDDLPRFDRAFFGHVNFVFTNMARAAIRALTSSRTVATMGRGPVRRQLQHLSRLSSAFVLISDFAMATLGGKLKRMEKLSGRMADALAWLYLASAAVKRFHDEGAPSRDEPFVTWSCVHARYQVQEALRGILDNLPNRPAAWLLSWVCFPLGAHFRPVDDRLGAKVARALLEDREERLHLTSAIYIPSASEPGLGKLEHALDAAVEALAVESRIRDAVREGRIDKAPGEALVELALAAGVITDADRDKLRAADEARAEIIRVDSFDRDEYRERAASRPSGRLGAQLG